MEKAKLNNRDRLLAVREIFHTHTDEDNYLTLEELTNHLASRGEIDKLSKKSLKDDIEALAKSGFDIVAEATKNGLAIPYHLASRPFEDYELRLLVDAIASAKFISESETNHLVSVLQSFTSRHKAKTLQPVMHTVKKPRGKIPFSIHYIQEAIAKHMMITFQYQGKFNERTRMFELRKDGGRYFVTPAHLIVDNGNYYLIGREEESKDLRTYRVDRIVDCQIFEPADSPVTVDPSYLSNMFSMYGGEAEKLTIRFRESLMPTVVDRFGTDIRCRRIDENWFEVEVSALFSDGFMGWLLQFADQTEILAPASRREEFRAKVEQLANLYQVGAPTA
ncbi:helix-turn-helix transcriptional regulator [Exiguobacterium flavidum]|uniref:helix-turn-helix transcriptional regulator n=1 Tax=Exiguobacterium flavidum TaxID=2184695 RepID=UPI000DF855EA|nr:WYL domain-containing protein [Exiguobacterium flavidum]